MVRRSEVQNEKRAGSGSDPQKVIAFDANLFDLGIITDNPYQQQCSARRKKLNAALKPLPFLKADEPIQKDDEKQLEMFI